MVGQTIAGAATGDQLIIHSATALSQLVTQMQAFKSSLDQMHATDLPGMTNSMHTALGGSAVATLEGTVQDWVRSLTYLIADVGAVQNALGLLATNAHSGLAVLSSLAGGATGVSPLSPGLQASSGGLGSIIF